MRRVAILAFIFGSFVVQNSLLASLAQGDATSFGSWKFWGGDLHNTHFAETESKIGPENVSQLQVKWVYHASGDISAIPTFDGGQLYITDWGLPFGLANLLGGGRIHAIDQESGQKIWSKKIGFYSRNHVNNISRSSPAIYQDLLIIGDVVSPSLPIFGIRKGHGAVLYAIHRKDGHLVWKTTLDDHPLAQVTQSPVIYDGKVYVGVSSQEEAAAKGHYPCCTFRGSMLAVAADTGKILWKTYTVPDNFKQVGGFSGNAVWGSAPCIDEKRQAVYIATGNNYSFPKPLSECLKKYVGNPSAQQTECYDKLDPPDNLSDSVLALELQTGKVRWAQKLQNYGAWTYSCDPNVVPWLPGNPKNCENIDALDFDFGQAPILLTTQIDHSPRDLVVAGQKSGTFWAFDPDQRGKIVWATPVGPGGVNGGMEMGAATDGEYIYAQVTNLEHTPFQLIAGKNSGLRVNGGIWAAIEPSTGKLVWQTPDPTSFLPHKGHLVHIIWGVGLGDGYFGFTMGPLTVANHVLYAGSMDRKGHMYALHSRTGEILWSFESGGSVMSAPSIANGVLYWGSGYQTGYNGHKLYSFTVPK